MGRYAKLGTLVVRWTAVGFFILAIVLVPLGIAGGGTMPSVMNGVQRAGTTTTMMGSSSAVWWGPLLLNVAMGSLLFALSKPIGSLIGAGLDD